MRHLNKGRKLNRTASHRKALFSNLASSLVINKKIITTLPKAKELQRFVERLVTYSKNSNLLHGRRLIQKRILGKLSKSVANELMHKIGPNYLARNGGYTRIIKLENRKNDDATKAMIAFVDFKEVNLETKEEEVEKNIIEKNK